MAYTTINKSSLHMNTKLYTGNGSTQSITSLDFQPDLIWIKQRNAVQNHRLVDSVRGNTKEIFSDLTTAEQTLTNGITAFNSNGFGLGSSNGYNQNAGTYASWNWKANGSGSSNTAGSINSTVSVNTTSGFSIVSYTGNGTGNSTIGHGLGTTPKFIIVKNLTTAQAWGTKSDSFVSASDPNVLYLNATSAQADDTNVWGTSATFNNNTFTVGDWNGSNQSGSNFIAYCWSEVQGYSKFGSYTGNGNADGTFVYTGFKPAFVMFKNTTGNNWGIIDNKRDSYNGALHRLSPNTSGADNTGAGVVVDLLSNGFKCRNADGLENGAAEIIYMAFAENPFVASNFNAATAR